MQNIVTNEFNAVYKAFGNQLYKNCENYSDNPVLNSLYNNLPIAEQKEYRTADDNFIEYIRYIQIETNENYLLFVLKFIILIREYFNKIHFEKQEEEEKNKTVEPNKTENKEDEKPENNSTPENPKEEKEGEKPKEEKEEEKPKEEKPKGKGEFSGQLKGEILPELCNDFYIGYLTDNAFFGFDDNEKSELLEIVQHFCIWLFKNGYTKSKLSLAKY